MLAGVSTSRSAGLPTAPAAWRVLPASLFLSKCPVLPQYKPRDPQSVGLSTGLPGPPTAPSIREYMEVSLWH